VGPADWRNNYLIDCRLVQSRPDLSPSHKELLLQLLHDQHRHGCTCASWAELGERMGLNPKNVKRGLRSLEMKVPGLLVIQTRTRAPSEITVNLEALPPRQQTELFSTEEEKPCRS
jgi:hypothetical protein